LQRVLGGPDGIAGLSFDARHLRLGPYAIHLATARVTQRGQPVEIDLPATRNLGDLPWLPYDEMLLDSIIATTRELARRLNA
jgi:hypothetical protein